MGFVNWGEKGSMCLLLMTVRDQVAFFSESLQKALKILPLSKTWGLSPQEVGVFSGEEVGTTCYSLLF